jgi:hypothetical protein
MGFLALFGVASFELWRNLAGGSGLYFVMVIVGPILPAFLQMRDEANPLGLLLFSSFGVCSAMLGLSSVVTYKKMAHEAMGTGKLRLAFGAGICCPLVLRLIFMVLLFIALGAFGGFRI